MTGLFKGSLESNFESNLELLRGRDAALAQKVAAAADTGAVTLEPAARGGLTAVLRDGAGPGAPMLLHSRVDPAQEAALLVGTANPEKSHYIVLGLGLGYHVAELLRRVGPQARLLVVEASPEILRAAMAAGDISHLVDDRATLVVGEDERGVARAAQRFLEPKGLSGLELVEHPASLRANPQYYRAARNAVRDAMGAVLVAVNTVVYYCHTWQLNHVINLPATVFCPGVGGLFGRFSGVPAFVVGAGPSLDKNGHLLAEARGRGVVLACDTALRPLLRAGVTPDAVLSIDGTYLNYKNFAGVSAPATTLVAEPMTYHSIVSEYQGPRLIASFGGPVMDWVERWCGKKGDLRAGGSVSTAAFYLAWRLGCNPIVFVGQDLSYPGGETYARGTFYADEGYRSGLGPQDMVAVPGVGGGTVLTPLFMKCFIDWFEEAIPFLKGCTPGLEVIDATEGGALIAGTRLMGLRQVLDDCCRKTAVDFRAAVDELQADYRAPDVGGFVAELARAEDRLARVRRACRRGLRLLAGNGAARGRPAAGGLLSTLSGVDAEIRGLGESLEVVELLLQPVLFSIMHRASLRAPSAEAALRDTLDLYENVAEAAVVLRRLLGEARGGLARGFDRFCGRGRARAGAAAGGVAGA